MGVGVGNGEGVEVAAGAGVAVVGVGVGGGEGVAVVRGDWAVVGTATGTGSPFSCTTTSAMLMAAAPASPTAPTPAHSRGRPREASAGGSAVSPGRRRRSRSGRQDARVWRSSRPSFASMLAICVLTVSGLRPSRTAISTFVPPLRNSLEHSLLGGGQGVRVRRASTASSGHRVTLAADPPNYITRSALRPEKWLQSPWPTRPATCPATCRMRSASATEVPPNFCTTRMEKGCASAPSGARGGGVAGWCNSLGGLLPSCPDAGLTTGLVPRSCLRLRRGRAASTRRDP